MIALFVVVLVALVAWLIADVTSGRMSLETAFFLVVVAAVGSLAYWGRRLASRKDREWLRRFDAGLCLHCGYDKRSDPRGRCPECGRF